MLGASYKHAQINRLPEIAWHASSASRGRHATSQPTGEAVEGPRGGRISRSGLRDLDDDWLRGTRRGTLGRSHGLLIIPVRLSLPLLKGSFIGRHLLADVDTAMKPFEHEKSKARHRSISRTHARSHILLNSLNLSAHVCWPILVRRLIPRCGCRHHRSGRIDRCASGPAAFAGVGEIKAMVQAISSPIFFIVVLRP
jgi:hypothetical protein